MFALLFLLKLLRFGNEAFLSGMARKEQLPFSVAYGVGLVEQPRVGLRQCGGTIFRDIRLKVL